MPSPLPAAKPSRKKRGPVSPPGPQDSRGAEMLREWLARSHTPYGAILSHPAMAEAPLVEGTLSQIVNGRRRPGRFVTDARRIAITKALADLGCQIGPQMWDLPPRASRKPAKGRKVARG